MPHSENKTHTSSAFDFLNGAGRGYFGTEIVNNLNAVSNSFKRRSIRLNFVYLSLYLCICFPMIHQLSVTLVAGLLRTQTLRPSASWSSQLPFPTLFRVGLIIAFLVTWSLFDYTICYPPCTRSVHTICTCSFPFSPKLFVSPALFLLLLNFWNPPVWRSLQLFSKNQFLFNVLPDIPMYY